MLYGAALIFFIGFMASLMVFVGKSAVASASGPASDIVAKDREPSYFFYYASTSYGWRDLSATDQFVETIEVTSPTGRPMKRVEFKDEYVKAMNANNYIARDGHLLAMDRIPIGARFWLQLFLDGEHNGLLPDAKPRG